MRGLEGIRDLAQEYRAKSGRRIERIRVSPNVPADHLYAGRFNGGPPEIVVGLDAWERIAGKWAPVLTHLHGMEVVDGR